MLCVSMDEYFIIIRASTSPAACEPRFNFTANLILELLSVNIHIYPCRDSLLYMCLSTALTKQQAKGQFQKKSLLILHRKLLSFFFDGVLIHINLRSFVLSGIHYKVINTDIQNKKRLGFNCYLYIFRSATPCLINSLPMDSS